MHRLYRVRFPVALPHETAASIARCLRHSLGFRDFLVESQSADHVYLHPFVLVEVRPATLEVLWLDVRDFVEPLGGIAFPPYVLWHSRFARGEKHYYPRRARSGPKLRARRRRETMLRDKQRILERCFTTEQG